MNSILNDGYTEKGIIKAVPRLHGELNFSFRPMSIEQFADYGRASDGVTGRRWRQVQAEVLARHLMSWSEIDAGLPAPITAARILKLKPRLFVRLFDIVTGNDVPDEQPDQSEEDIGATAADLLKAAETGRSVREIREERERGNS